jgi:hypothetical protein
MGNVLLYYWPFEHLVPLPPGRLTNRLKRVRHILLTDRCNSVHPSTAPQVFRVYISKAAHHSDFQENVLLWYTACFILWIMQRKDYLEGSHNGIFLKYRHMSLLAVLCKHHEDWLKCSIKNSLYVKVRQNAEVPKHQQVSALTCLRFWPTCLVLSSTISVSGMAVDPSAGYVVTHKTRSPVTQCHRPLPTKAARKMQTYLCWQVIFSYRHWQ